MTTRQAELINIMFSQHYNSATYKDAYSELVGRCDHEPKAAPTVTLTTGTSAPPPPSTPKPLGPDWWRERTIEANREMYETIKDQTKTIQALQKQIAEDKEHWENKAAIDDSYRNHNKELVAANGDIYEALRHWGLGRSGQCSLVDNVKHVIQLCAERGKEIVEAKEALRDHGLYQAGLGGLAKNVKNVALMCEERGKRCSEQQDKIERLNDLLDSQTKVIEKLSEQRDQWEKLAAERTEMLREKDAKIEDLKRNVTESIIASNQILNALNENDLRQQSGSLADNVVEVINRYVAQKFVIRELNRQVEERGNQIDRQAKIIEVLERTALARQQFAQKDREISHRKTVEIEELKKQLVVAGKKRRAIVDVGNNMREVLRGIINNNAMSHSEAQTGQHAIQLWEDNTL